MTQPFNLSEMLAGKAVICRNGLVPYNISYYKDLSLLPLPDDINNINNTGIVLFQVNIDYLSTLLRVNAIDGRISTLVESPYDLLMFTEKNTKKIKVFESKQTGFVNVYEDEKAPNGIDTSFIFKTKEEADADNIANSRISTGIIIF